MDPRAFQILSEIKKIYPDQYGKIYQKLLGLTFEDVGFDIEEKSIQGVDLHIKRSAGEKYALEVKTSEKVEIILGKKDIKGVEVRKSDGYIPGFAALRLGLLAQWVIASAANINPGKVPIPLLESQSFDDLQDQVRKSFPQVVLDIGKRLLREKPQSPQIWLNQKLSYFAD